MVCLDVYFCEWEICSPLPRIILLLNQELMPRRILLLLLHRSKNLGPPEFTTPFRTAPGSGSTPQTISLEKYNELIARFNQLQEALLKVCECKDHYKNESVSFSGSLSNNVEELKCAYCSGSD